MGIEYQGRVEPETSIGMPDHLPEWSVQLTLQTNGTSCQGRTIVTEVPGTTNQGTRNGKRGTVLGRDFYTGMKMFPVSVTVTGSRTPNLHCLVPD
jgi:hypothetical protein